MLVTLAAGLAAAGQPRPAPVGMLLGLHRLRRARAVDRRLDPQRGGRAADQRAGDPADDRRALSASRFPSPPTLAGRCSRARRVERPRAGGWFGRSPTTARELSLPGDLGPRPRRRSRSWPPGRCSACPWPCARCAGSLVRDLVDTPGGRGSGRIGAVPRPADCRSGWAERTQVERVSSTRRRLALRPVRGSLVTGGCWRRRRPARAGTGAFAVGLWRSSLTAVADSLLPAGDRSTGRRSPSTVASRSAAARRVAPSAEGLRLRCRPRTRASASAMFVVGALAWGAGGCGTGGCSGSSSRSPRRCSV